MKRIIIDGAYVESMTKLHDMLKFSLDLPTWYGRNLDALYDCLTGELSEKTVILSRNGCPSYGQKTAQLPHSLQMLSM